MFTLIKLGLFEEFERFKTLSDSRISIRKTKLKSKTKLLKAKAKPDKSSRKDSKSTRRPSESSASENISEEDFNNEINKEKKRNKILDKLYTELEQNIENEKDAILELLNIKEHKDLFEKGICTTFSTNKGFADLLKQFMRDAAAVNKCPHCNAV